MIEVREKRMGHHEGGRSRSRRDILPERDQERHPNRTTLPTTGPSQPSCVLRSWQSEGRRVKFLFQSCKAQVREIKAAITQPFEGNVVRFGCLSWSMAGRISRRLRLRPKGTKKDI